MPEGGKAGRLRIRLGSRREDGTEGDVVGALLPRDNGLFGIVSRVSDDRIAQPRPRLSDSRTETSGVEIKTELLGNNESRVDVDDDVRVDFPQPLDDSPRLAGENIVFCLMIAELHPADSCLGGLNDGCLHGLVGEAIGDEADGRGRKRHSDQSTTTIARSATVPDESVTRTRYGPEASVPASRSGSRHSAPGVASNDDSNTVRPVRSKRCSCRRPTVSVRIVMTDSCPAGCGATSIRETPLS